MRLRTLTLALLMCVAVPLAAQQPQRRSFTAVRAEKGPVIDGDLGDAAWQSAPEITGFTQHDPNDGQPAMQETKVKVVYDNDAIYFGAFMAEAQKVTPLLTRRDNDLNNSDYFRISIDSQLDRQNGASFMVNASNVQVDMVLYNDIYDDWSWDAVWHSAAKIVPGGWVAEVRIPYSQLRFPKRDVHTWGINFGRYTYRLKEAARLVNTPKNETGFVSRFADLTGIENIRPPRGFEVMPYGVARNDLHSRIDQNDPFAETSTGRIDGGVDMKYGLSSNLTLTGTINPDFGQVEVDPAVLNLSQFETFFPEKRPFFTEGAQIFRFGNGPANSRWGFNVGFPTFFYSRRVGRSPQVFPSADYSDAPGETTILGAAKITGKIGEGWTIGVLDALTDAEDGFFERTTIDTTSGNFVTDRWQQRVEPMSNYFVARATKDYGKDSRVGAMVTSTKRFLNDATENALRENAYFAGIDGHTRFKEKTWIFEWLGGTSLVDGSSTSIASTQRSGLRYYQRPDADHIEYDPSRTSLSGWTMRTTLNKQTGKWRPNLQVHAYSPGFEINDVGFATRSDAISTHGVIHYVNQDVTKRFRERSFWIGKYQNFNFDRDTIANGIASDWSMTFANYWYMWGWLGAQGDRIDDRKTRGGPVVVNPSDHYYGTGLGTDTRKKYSMEVWGERTSDEDGGRSYMLGTWLSYRPTTALRMTLLPEYRVAREFAQYVTTVSDSTATATFGNRYVFGTLEQRTLNIGIRTEWTVNARLSFQLYLQPFIASGDYHDFKQLARARSDDYVPYTASVGNPDFNLRSVRGNAVVRWEFRPGSALYVVWNENREDVVPVGDFNFRRDFSALPNAPSTDVFMVKVSYWLPL
jgi:Domain of unknown function (DUF5916)/Carbohydrate family 9 binding domain-like